MLSRLVTKCTAPFVSAILIGGAAGSLGMYPGQASAQAAPGNMATQVGVMTLKDQQVPYSITLPGRAVAYQQTDIVPRVGGTIEAITYTAGDRVKKGDVLFRLDDDTYKIDVSAAEAAKDSAEAQVATAKATVERYQKLKGVSSFSQADMDTAVASLASARASLASAEADLETAKLNLSYTTIRSPIDGIVDVNEFSIGTVVTASQSDALTTVTRLDPIYVDVQESSSQMLRIRDMIEAGTLTAKDTPGIELTLENGQTYSGDAKVVSPRTTVSTTTSTIDYRLQFKNPDHVVLPGQFLRVTLTLGTIPAILVPQRATTRGTDGKLTAFIASDGVAKQVTLTENGSYQNAWIVTDGVEAGDKLLLDGLQDLKAGTKITTVPVTLDKDGVVQDVKADDSSKSSGE